MKEEDDTKEDTVTYKIIAKVSSNKSIIKRTRNVLTFLVKKIKECASNTKMY